MLRIQDRGKCGKGTKLHWGGGGDLTHFHIGGAIGVRKDIYCKGGHSTYFVDGEKSGVGTPQNIKRYHQLISKW